jgi:dihydroorotate dehydrogenase electron transfer subunit
MERHTSNNFPGESPDSALFTLTFRNPGWESWYPGQFVMIRPQSVTRPDILWARPFSISQADAEEVTIVFQTVGRGTLDMLGLQRGELVTVWGPLGNAFAVSHAGPTLLLAGGIGIAPFVGYIEKHPEPESLRLEFGHRLPLECYPFADCIAPGCVLVDSADDSGFYAKNHHECSPADLNRFIRVLEKSICDTASKNGLVLACGPMPFLHSVQKSALRHRVRAQLLLETRMSCGVGACLGCVVKKSVAAKDPAPETPGAFEYVQTCTKGPVFWADEIDLEHA